jgi:hypothetical protein
MKYKLFSLGHRCSSAGILKYLGIKTESYPFDWMISRLNIIQDCIETDFIHFLKKENYEEKKTTTIHYSKHGNKFLCNENIVYNTYYQNKYNNDELFIPDPLSLPNDTYAHYLALNHRNILQDNDYEYFQRCIERFKSMIYDNEPKMYLYIHPVISTDDYQNQKDKIIQLFLNFQSYMSTINKNTHILGLFILVVRTHYDDPVSEHLSDITENVYYNLPSENNETSLHEDNANPQCCIKVLYTHKDFMDAGEIFLQQNNELETSTLINIVKNFVT